MIWMDLIDDDDDPIADIGDLGKIDRLGGGDLSDEPDGEADNYLENADAKACSDDDGEGCDAVWEDTLTVTFADGTFGCKSTRDVALKCTWDADGSMAPARTALPETFDEDNSNSQKGWWLKCEVEE